jgi:hypothetical protein
MARVAIILDLAFQQHKQLCTIVAVRVADATLKGSRGFGAALFSPRKPVASVTAVFEE